jgi:hypothetical protein
MIGDPVFLLPLALEACSGADRRGKRALTNGVP